MVDRVKICIAGKNNIAVNVTDYILKNFPEVEIIAIFNRNDDGKNKFQRSFQRYCLHKKIVETNLNSVCDEKDLIFLSLEFDKIIKPESFKTKELYNIHFSYLPEYKGMYTSALPILRGENYTGVTLHKIDRGIDTGSIIEQIKIPISNTLTCEELYDKYIEKGTELVIRNLSSILSNSATSFPQPADKSTYFSKKSLDYSDIKIDLKTTAFQIQRQINAFVFPMYQMPTILGIPVYKAIVSDIQSLETPGTLMSENKYSFEFSTIDYNIYIQKDLRAELFELAKVGDIGSLRHWVDAGYSINQRSKEGWDIAIIAAYHGQYSFLDCLIDKYNWNVHTRNNNGTSLAMYIMTNASAEGNIRYLKYFLDKLRIDIHHADFDGVSFLDYAKKYGNKEVESLISTLE